MINTPFCLPLGEGGLAPARWDEGNNIRNALISQKSKIFDSFSQEKPFFLSL